MPKYDFCGYATKNDLRCSDGRIIRSGAFRDCDGKTVPLVWQHVHNDSDNVLGHAVLENRKDGVYAYGYFNNTPKGQNAKELVRHGDITQMSIYANKLQEMGSEVLHGVIREVSLVLSGANPGARIDNVSIAHADGTMEVLDDEAVIFPGLYISHSDLDDEEDEDMGKKGLMHGDDDEDEGGRTLADVFAEMTDEQKEVVYAAAAAASEDDDEDEDDEDYEDEDYDDDELEQSDYFDEEGYFMKHNVFEDGGAAYTGAVLSHDDMEMIIKDAKRLGSLKDSVLEHAGTYGINDIDMLFPDTKTLTNTPEFIRREQDWVSDVMGKVHHTPFTRIKSMFADITEDEARAKGYITGNRKTEEVFGLLKRTTTPQTVYKKQKLDRDDIVDITDFDVVAWLKQEMRIMLNEELARAFLIGDGRSGASNDKINEQNIRPIISDDDLFVVKTKVGVSGQASDDVKAKAIIRAAIKSRKNYKGSGNPTFYTTEDVLTDMLLLEDGIGHKLYKTEQELATALRVTKIVTVPVMEGYTRTVTISDGQGGTTTEVRPLVGIIVNLADYNVGTDKGGSISFFDDFDIDYNQQKYLIETRLSAALTKPFSAIVLELGSGDTAIGGNYIPVTPSGDENPAQEGWYEKTSGDMVATADTTVTANKQYYKKVNL